MKQSERIEKEIKKLTDERESLINKLKVIPKGKYEEKFRGYSLTYNEPRYWRRLELDGKPISKEKLKELQTTAEKENEPHLNRIKEIDDLISSLQKKLDETKINELLEGKSQFDKNTIKGKTKRKDKHIFIDTFIEKSKEVIFNTNTDIARNCNVSKTWVTNHFNSLLKEIYDQMNDEYSNIIERDRERQLYANYEVKSNIEIFATNISFIKRRLEKLKDKNTIQSHLKKIRT